jgi:type VII secretion-associated serine protease mycosin
VAALLATLAVLPAKPAFAEPACPAPGQPGQQITAVPWPQQRYEPDRLAGVADGAGITVAVVDSGVDATHPRLTGAVLHGEDLLDGGPSGGQRDCVGHGTAVASLIVASPTPGLGFAGLAPKARILPFRVSERELVDGRPTGRAGTVDGLARAIRDATDSHAQVINLSLASPADDPQVRAAVEYARAHDVVLVAAVGNEHRDGEVDQPSYPAAYPGVLGVGAVDESGVRLPQSQVGRYVSLVAPGANVVAAARGQGLARYDGTSFAAPFVSATAALILQYHRGRHPHADDVVARILATVDPAPAGAPDPGYGYGILNPYRAVTEQLGPARVPAPAAAPVHLTRTEPAGDRSGGRMTALWLATGGILLAGLVALVATVLPRGAARHWRPGHG